MIFFINAIISCGYLYIIKDIKKINFLHFFPLIFLWTIIEGFQYDVGTDYFSYLKIFESEARLNYYYEFKKEYIFFYFIKILKIFFNNGQVLFIFVSFFESILFYLYIKNMLKFKILKKKYLYIYVFLYLCFGTNFYNQLNGIRQYFNIYLLSLLPFYIYNNNFFKYFFTLLIGINIHRSFFLFFPIYVFKITLKKLSSKKIIILIFLGIIFNFLPVIEILRTVISFIPNYSYYANHWYFKEIVISQKITKFIFFPFYIFSAFLINKEKNNIKNFILKFGILSYIIKIFALKLSITNRMGEYFTLLSIYPIYILIEEYIKRKKNINLFILIVLILGIFITKVLIFPRNEYLYKFYFFN